VDTKNCVDSNEWEIIDHPAVKNTKYRSSRSESQDPHPYLTFTVKIKRVAVFYTYILVIPCLLLSFLTLVIFWLPPESPAKMILGNVDTSSLHQGRLLMGGGWETDLPRFQNWGGVATKGLH